MNISFVGKQDKNTDILLGLIKEEFREFDLAFEFVNSGKRFDTNFHEAGWDVVFLDADIPDINLKKIRNEERDLVPLFILISSLESKALKAFEINAIDFLLKPLRDEKIKKSLDILRKKMVAYKIVNGFNHHDKLRLAAKRSDNSRYMRRILIRKGKKMFFVDVGSIVWIESEGNYNRIHTQDDSYLIRGTLKHTLKKLDPGKFFRIHRSAIINIDKVKQIEPFFHGDYKIFMRDHTELKISRTYSDFLSEFKCTV